MVVKKKCSPPGWKLGRNPLDLVGWTQSHNCCGTHRWEGNPPLSVSSHFVSKTHSSSVSKAQDRPVTRVEMKARPTEIKIREKFMVELELHRPHTCVKKIHCNSYYKGFPVEILKQSDKMTDFKLSFKNSYPLENSFKKQILLGEKGILTCWQMEILLLTWSPIGSQSFIYQFSIYETE